MSNNLYLYYREFNLGELKFLSDIYFWLPNSNNINLANNKYPAGMDLFFLPNKKQSYNSVPVHFNNFLIGAGREDLIQKACILSQDDDFTKLLKLSNLEFYNQDFVIKNK